MVRRQYLVNKKPLGAARGTEFSCIAIDDMSVGHHVEQPEKEAKCSKANKVSPKPQ